MRFLGFFLVCSLLAWRCPGAVSAVDETAAEIQKHAEQARLALSQNDLERAEQEYQAILKLDPRNASVYAALGVAFYGSGKPADAESALRTALHLDPNQSQAEAFLGLAESEQGHCQEATPILAKQYNSQHDLKLRRLLGLSLLNCHLTSSDFDSALGVARTLRQSYPDDPDVLYTLAGLYTRLWDSVASDLMEKHPESYRVHQLAGEVMEAQGRADRAIKEYQLALKQNPKVPQVNNRIGRLLLLTGGPDANRKARERFQQELAVNPRDASSEYWIGVIDTDMHGLTEAVAHFERAKKLDPQFAQAYVGLAKVFLQQKQPAKAAEELQQAIRLNPESSTAHYELMEAYRDQGQLAEAQREMALFQKLQKAEAESFRFRLDSLLSGQSRDVKNAD